MDLETEWAGVLQRWGNSGDTSVRLTDNSVRQSDSLHRQTNTQARTESHDILGSSRFNRQQDGLERRSSNHNNAYDTLDRKSSNKLESLERRSNNFEIERKPSSGEEERKRTERQTTRDRDWRESGSKTGGRARWSSVSRGSVSPGKENIETGCR